MNRLLISSRILQAQGILLLVVAAIHLLVIRSLRGVFMHLLSAGAFRFVWPPFLLNHVVVGILLLAVGGSTLLSAGGVRAGERRSWWIELINAITILSLPIVLALVMEPRYFSATPFLVATILITAVGVSMIWPLLWVRSRLNS